MSVTNAKIAARRKKIRELSMRYAHKVHKPQKNPITAYPRNPTERRAYFYQSLQSYELAVSNLAAAFAHHVTDFLYCLDEVFDTSDEAAVVNALYLANHYIKVGEALNITANGTAKQDLMTELKLAHTKLLDLSSNFSF